MKNIDIMSAVVDILAEGKPSQLKEVDDGGHFYDDHEELGIKEILDLGTALEKKCKLFLNTHHDSRDLTNNQMEALSSCKEVIRRFVPLLYRFGSDLDEKAQWDEE